MDATFLDYDISNLEKLQKKEKGYDEKSVNHYEYADRMVHQLINNSDLGVGIGKADDIKDAISIFVGKNHAEKEYEKALRDFTTSKDVSKFGAQRAILTGNKDFVTRMNLTDKKFLDIGTGLEKIAEDLNKGITDPKERIRRFKLVNNSVKDTIDSGVIKIITADGVEKEMSILKKINTKLEDSSAKTLKSYLDSYSQARTQISQTVRKNAKIISDYIKSDANLSIAFSGKSAKDIDKMIRDHKNGVANNALAELQKKLPTEDVINIAETIKNTKNVAEKQQALDKTSHKRTANIRKMATKPLQNTDAMRGFSSVRSVVDTIRKTVSMSKKFYENAAMKTYTKAGKQMNANKEAIDAIKAKGHNLSLRDQQKISRLEGKNVKLENRSLRGQNRLEKINQKNIKRSSRKTAKKVAKEGVRSSGNILRSIDGLRRKPKGTFRNRTTVATKLYFKIVFTIMGFVTQMAFFIMALLLPVMAILQIFGGGTHATAEELLAEVIESIRGDITKEERRDIFCDAINDYRIATGSRVELENGNKGWKPAMQSSATAGLAAYTLYISDMGDPIYNYENSPNTFGMWQWNNDYIVSLITGCTEKINNITDKPVTRSYNGHVPGDSFLTAYDAPATLNICVFTETSLDTMIDSFADSELEDADAFKFEESHIKEMIQGQAFLTIYYLEKYEPTIYEYLTNFEGIYEDEAAEVARYLATSSIAHKNFTDKEIEEIEKLAKEIAADEISTITKVKIDFDGISENIDTKIPSEYSNESYEKNKIIAKLLTDEHKNLSTTISFRHGVFGVDNYNYTVNSELEGLYTELNGEGIKVFDGDGEMVVDMYCNWKTLYAHYTPYDEIDVPIYCTSTEEIKEIPHEHTDECKKELGCSYKAYLYHPHTNDCIGTCKYYNYTGKLLYQGTSHITMTQSGYWVDEYKCDYKNASGHPHEDNCYEYACDDSPRSKNVTTYSYVPYWTGKNEKGYIIKTINITGFPDTGLNGGTYQADPYFIGKGKVIFEAPEELSTYVVEEDLLE